jgi:hypothetical protein
MNKKQGVKVRPTSRKIIRNLTLKLRGILGLQNHCYFPVVDFLERGMPKIFPEFNYEYVEKTKMGRVEGLTIPETNTIQIREDVYVAATKNEGRARFTIAHEIAHYIIHKDQPPCFARVNEVLPVYVDPEWQANVFAAELLMPFHLVVEKTADEIVEKCKVSREAAEYRLSKIKS